MRYPVVLFDVGETLVGPRESFGAVYARVLAGFGVHRPAEVLEAALREVWQEFDLAIPPGVDRYGHFPGGEREYWLRFARATIERALDGDPPPELAEQALENLRKAFKGPEAWHIYDEVLPTLETLEALHVRLGVVSNWDSRLPSVLETLGLSRYFECVVVSHLEGVEKPDPGLFRIALERMGVEPGDAIHVGDRPELDLEGAWAAGIDGVIVDRRGHHDGGFPVVSDLSPLPAIARDGLPG